LVPDLVVGALLDKGVAELVTVEEEGAVLGVRVEHDVVVVTVGRAEVVVGVRRRLIDIFRVVEHNVGVEASCMDLGPSVEVGALFDAAHAHVLCAHDVQRLVARVRPETLVSVPVGLGAHGALAAGDDGHRRSGRGSCDRDEFTGGAVKAIPHLAGALVLNVVGDIVEDIAGAKRTAGVIVAGVDDAAVAIEGIAGVAGAAVLPAVDTAGAERAAGVVVAGVCDTRVAVVGVARVALALVGAVHHGARAGTAGVG